MAFLLIAVVVIIIVVVSVQINNVNNSTLEYDVSYDLVTKEVISLLETLQEFYKGVTDFSGLVMIIPVDGSGVLYGIGSNEIADRIQISLLFYDEVEGFLLNIIDNKAKQTGTDKSFKLKKRDGSTFYTAVSTYRFNGKYKKFMPYLHNAVVKRFPELGIQFDGSKIDIAHM